MKATGIVRRIDDLGRVVIPKEIRRIRPGSGTDFSLCSAVSIILYAFSVESHLKAMTTRPGGATSRHCTYHLCVFQTYSVSETSAKVRPFKG